MNRADFEGIYPENVKTNDIYLGSNCFFLVLRALQLEDDVFEIIYLTQKGKIFNISEHEGNILFYGPFSLLKKEP